MYGQSLYCIFFYISVACFLFIFTFVHYFFFYKLLVQVLHLLLKFIHLKPLSNLHMPHTASLVEKPSQDKVDVNCFTTSLPFFLKKCIIKYFKKIDVSKLFLSFLFFFFFLFFLIFFLILVFSLFFQFFFLFLSPSSVYPVCVQPAVDIIPGTGFSFPGSSRATGRIPGWKKGPAKCWSASY